MVSLYLGSYISCSHVSLASHYHQHVELCSISQYHNNANNLVILMNLTILLSSFYFCYLKTQDLRTGKQPRQNTEPRDDDDEERDEGGRAAVGVVTQARTGRDRSCPRSEPSPPSGTEDPGARGETTGEPDLAGGPPPRQTPSYAGRRNLPQ